MSPGFLRTPVLLAVLGIVVEEHIVSPQVHTCRLFHFAHMSAAVILGQVPAEEQPEKDKEACCMIGHSFRSA